VEPESGPYSSTLMCSYQKRRLKKKKTDWQREVHFFRKEVKVGLFIGEHIRRDPNEVLSLLSYHVECIIRSSTYYQVPFICCLSTRLLSYLPPDLF
jgi:hypothetical protein